MADHVLKCWSPYWDAIERGDKTFEVRRDDRGFQRGDILVLQKYEQAKHQYVMTGYGFDAEPKTLRREILYILTGGQLGIEAGYVVMALASPSPQTKEGGR